MIEQVKGTRNIHSEDAQVYLFILNTFLNTFNSSGYEYTELPQLNIKNYLQNLLVNPQKL